MIPKCSLRLNAIDWTAGSLETALPSLKDGSGVLVADRFQTAKGYDVGDPITLKVGRAEQEFTIVGIVSSAGLDLATQLFGVRDLYSEYAVSTVFLDRRVVAEVFGNNEVHLLQANLSDGLMTPKQSFVSPKPPPGWCSVRGDGFWGTIDDISRTSMAIMTSVAFGALGLGDVGHRKCGRRQPPRTAFEYGVMRGVGASRTAVARIIFGEAIILSLTAIVMGVTLGMHFANFDRMHYAGLVGIELRPRPVLGPTALSAATTLGMCVLASAIPLRRLLNQPLRYSSRRDETDERASSISDCQRLRAQPETNLPPSNHYPRRVGRAEAPSALGCDWYGKTFTMANLIEKVQRPTLVLCHNKTLAAQLYEEMRALFPDNAVSYFVSYYDYFQPGLHPAA